MKSGRIMRVFISLVALFVLGYIYSHWLNVPSKNIE